MAAPKILFYAKPFCPWCRSMKSFLDSTGLAYEYLDVIKDKKLFEEMVKKTGQEAAPCVEIDGHMLADTDAAAVETYMKVKGLLKV